MAFIKNIWYVAAWNTEMEPGKILARTIIGNPIVFWRDSNGELIAMEDRCPHRHAALSLGRLEGDEIRCMYHGLKFNQSGKCSHVPGTDRIPPNSDVKTYPVVEKYDWFWVWLGDPELADESKIPRAYGISNDDYAMSPGGGLSYEANYQLINDNLTDLTHIDYVHETTLGEATGVVWSDAPYDLTIREDGVIFQRWLAKHHDPECDQNVDRWNTLRYLLPGLFLQETALYPVGTAEKCDFKAPPENFDVKPIAERVDQQAVTPINEQQTRYLYAAGVKQEYAKVDEKTKIGIDTVNAAFAEDRIMIESQQKIWNLSDPDQKKAFIPNDKAPNMIRKLILKRIAEET